MSGASATAEHLTASIAVLLTDILQLGVCDSPICVNAYSESPEGIAMSPPLQDEHPSDTLTAPLAASTPAAMGRFLESSAAQAQVPLPVYIHTVFSDLSRLCDARLETLFSAVILLERLQQVNIILYQEHRQRLNHAAADEELEKRHKKPYYTDDDSSSVGPLTDATGYTPHMHGCSDPRAHEPLPLLHPMLLPTCSRLSPSCAVCPTCRDCTTIFSIHRRNVHLFLAACVLIAMDAYESSLTTARQEEWSTTAFRDAVASMCQCSTTLLTVAERVTLDALRGHVAVPPVELERFLRRIGAVVI